MRKKIAILVGQPKEDYQTAFLHGFLSQAFSDDYDVCIFAMYLKHQATKEKEYGEASIFALVEYDRFDAIIILANTIQTQGILDYLDEDLHEKYDRPVIFVDLPSKYFHSVAADNSLPVKRLISHLIEDHGYTDIAYLTGNEYHPHAQQRLQSFKEVMQEHGIEVPENRMFYGDFWYNSGNATAEKLLLDREHLPQAVACANDYMAIGLIRALESAGIRVPEDIAVTGYDASQEARSFHIPVTSITIPAREIGKYCANYVKAVAEGLDVPEFSTPSEMFIGGSCGCPQEKYSTLSIDEHEDYEPDSAPDLGMMEDNLLKQTENLGMLNTIFSYCNQLRPFERFHLCLNSDWATDGFGNEISKKYTDQIVDALRCGKNGKGEDKVDLFALFDRKMILPELWEESEKPRAYYFTPLFFEDHVFGYAAVSYGDEIRCFTEFYRGWLGAVMRGLESYIRTRILQIKNAALETSQIRDDVTGLYNYKGFLEYTVASLNESSELSGYVDVLAIELCGLTEIYMNEGSGAGNKLLREFAQMLFQVCAQESPCYLGNNEFLVVRTLQDETETDWESLTGELHQKLEQYCAGNELTGKLRLATGSMHGKTETEEKLGNLVGEAVTKKNGNKIKEQRLEQQTLTLTEQEQHMLELVTDILDHNRLTYFFQPIVKAGTGDIYAYEALMRANTEEKISPLDILKYAEHLGRLQDVEKATFFNVLTFVEEHLDLFVNKKIFINSIPGIQLQESIAEQIREKLLALSGKVVVELTEQAELNDSELESLKMKYEDLGVDTAVDDYGTGFSNVYNLLRYMPNVVKIDRMLLANIQLSAQKQHFVKEIIEFSHNNGITVLAEGVETQEELKMVASLGTDLIQGYYTARPKAEVIQRIDHQIQNEIVQFGQYAQEKNRRKVYQAGQDANISLIHMATGHYSKIQFTQGNVPHRDVSIEGMHGFQANVEIEIEDSYTGRIELRDVDLAVHSEQPTIRLGENCDVTLVLVGENILEQGGILVPESSKLTVQGDGTLWIQQIAINGYGIGNDKDNKCGDLYFEQDGRIEISGNTVHGVGIGAGMGGNIHINKGLYSIQFAGDEAVGIGALYADVDLFIQYCSIQMNIKDRVSVGIGSLKGNANIELLKTNVKSLFNANHCVGIGTLEGDHMKFSLTDGVAEVNGRADSMCGIGSIDGDADISATKFGISIYAEGAEAIGLGNLKKTANIHTHNGDFVVHVKNRLNYDIGAETFEMINGYSEFRLNNQKITREPIEGEI